ncbi:MAG: C25 family cysteine peptidase [Desulfobacterales bacterium]|nr:C25 family cysteine peptidase [Desulfobacterales bacterium]
MSNEINWKKRLTLAESELFTKDKVPRGDVVGDQTVINLGAFSREYKLSRAYRSIRNLEFRSERPVKPKTFKDYLKERGDLIRVRFSAETKRRPRFPRDEGYRNRKTLLHYPNGVVLVLVEKSIYEAVSASIDKYVLDLGRDGYWATIHVISGGTPANIRSYIKRRKPVGAVLVGSIAAPWFELDDDFHGAHSEFPCDLFYMDTNGTWTDPDGDGKFSNHTGDLNPEIWVARIWTPTASGNDASLINDYFSRNHKFRLGLLGNARSALAYVDDDWTSFDDCAFDEMFPSSVITKYTVPTQTDADLYKAEVNSLRSWVQLCAHSWVHGHALRVGSINEYIQTSYFRDTNPPNAHFYNLFCCGPGKFTESDYLAGWYIFDKSGGGVNLGLTAIASAKSGSMLFFEDFYRPMGQGKVIGDAFVDWWKARGPDHELWERRWFYGLVLLGDPTLTWWKGAVPQLEQPQEEDIFDHWPRKMQFRWDPVNLPGVKYHVQVDAFGAVTAGKWAEETGAYCYNYHNITSNKLNHTFVGAQRGRWRVRAKVGSRMCSWSPWSYFRFTV